MSVKYIKIRFNTEDPSDRELLDRLKGMEGQNKFIKNAVLSYIGKGKEDIIAEKVAALLLNNLRTLPVIQSENVDSDAADESADIALRQIEEKQYAKPFGYDTRHLIEIGINFSTHTRRIDGWKMKD